LFDAVFEMNAAKNHADFISSITAAMGRLIRSDHCSIHVLDRPGQRMLQQSFPSDPFIPEEVAYYRAHPAENALVVHYESTGDRQARRRSDVIDMKTFLASNHYRHCLARLGFKYCLALPVNVDRDTIAGLVFDRCDRDYTKADCALLDAFAPHFLLAWNRQKNPWRHRTREPKPRDGNAPTPREADVLYWITEGKQNREIATILGISLYTVQKHVANLLRKLVVENRHALTVSALTHAAVRELKRTVSGDG
jgi:DNA-binding CsgD family transcriptional regulator